MLQLLAGDVRLEWARGAGAETCASRAQLESRAHRELGLTSLTRTATATAVEGFAECEASGCTAQLAVIGPSGDLVGRRALSAPDCARLEQAVLLAVSLMSEAPRTPLRAGPIEPLSPPKKPPPAGLSAELKGLVQDGLQPGGLELGADLAVYSPAWRGFRVGIGLRHLPLTREDAIGVSVSAGRLELCWGGPVLFERLEARTCLGGHLGSTTVSVVSDQEIQATGSGTFLWSGVAAGGAATVQLWGPLSAVLEVQLLVPLMRRSLEIENRRQLGFREAPLVLTAAPGLAVTL